MRKLIEIPIHFVRRVLYFTYAIITNLVCALIYLFTLEPHTWKVVTKRKIHRIRKLTAYKLWCWKHFGWFYRFIEVDDYYKELETKFAYGM